MSLSGRSPADQNPEDSGYEIGVVYTETIIHLFAEMHGLADPTSLIINQLL